MAGQAWPRLVEARGCPELDPTLVGPAVVEGESAGASGLRFSTYIYICIFHIAPDLSGGVRPLSMTWLRARVRARIGVRGYRLGVRAQG